MMILLVVSISIGIWKREQLMRLWAVNSLFEQDRIVANFSNMDGAFLTTEVARGSGPVSPLPQGPEATLPDGAQQWIAERAVTSLLVL